MNTEKKSSKTTVIVVLAIVLIASVGFNLFLLTRNPTSASKNDFIDPVDDAIAEADMTLHRNANSTDTRAVFYEKSDIEKYFKCVWPYLTTHNPDPTNYHWAVGFYFVRKPVNGTRKLSFYVAPTLVKSKIDDLNNKPLDFVLYHGKPTYYTQHPAIPACPLDTTRTKALTDLVTGNAYNAGQLWP